MSVMKSMKERPASSSRHGSRRTKLLLENDNGYSKNLDLMPELSGMATTTKSSTSHSKHDHEPKLAPTSIQSGRNDVTVISTDANSISTTLSPALATNVDYILSMKRNYATLAEFSKKQQAALRLAQDELAVLRGQLVEQTEASVESAAQRTLIETLRSRLKSNEDLLDQTSTDRDRYASQLHQATSSLSLVSHARDDLASRLAQASHELDRAREAEKGLLSEARVEGYQRQVTALEQDLIQRDKDVEAVTVELSKVRKEVDALRVSAQQQTNVQHRLNQENRNLKEDNTRLRLRAETATQRLGNTTAELRASKDDSLRLVEQHTLLKSQNKLLRDEYERLRQRGGAHMLAEGSHKASSGDHSGLTPGGGSTDPRARKHTKVAREDSGGGSGPAASSSTTLEQAQASVSRAFPSAEALLANADSPEATELIRELRAGQAVLRAQFEALWIDKRDVEARVAQLTDAARMARAELSVSAEREQQQRLAMTELAAQVAALTQETTVLLSQRESVISELDKAQASLDELIAAVEAARTGEATARAAQREAEAALETFKRQASDAEAQARDAADANASRAAPLADRVSELEAEVASLMEARGAAEVDKERKEREIASLRARVVSMNEEGLRLKEKLIALEDEHDRRARQDAEAAAAVTESRANTDSTPRLDVGDETDATKKQEEEDAASLVATLQSQLGAAQAQVLKVQRENAELQTALKVLR